MENIVNEAKAEFGRAKNRVARALETTPDDRIAWSPSPTSRTPIEIVAHAATSTAGIHSMLKGNKFPFTSTEEMDASTRSEEKGYSTREQAIAVLDKTSADYLNWLDSLTPEQVASTIDMGFGTFPMAMAITFPADHLRSHAAQIDYIQTIYGDRDWHM